MRLMRRHVQANFAISVTEALAQLHSSKAAHLRLSPPNVLLCRAGTWKLGDFGLHEMTASWMSHLSSDSYLQYAAPGVHGHTPQNFVHAGTGWAVFLKNALV